MERVTPVPQKACDEPKGSMLEIKNAEKQLWSLIYSKGLLHKEARELYVNVCSKYEKILLRDQEKLEFQEIEYLLWKLHYKHIHEFRKRISQSSTSIGCKESEIDDPVEKYKLFLTEAAKFYENLISKIREIYGLGEDPSLEEKGGVSCDPVKLHKCQYSCHRFLVCLGDLARYGELCKNIDVQRRNWSVSATYYFKAGSSWPDSGNPQNQLAVLAKYIGDDFLALYHCIRSLAVKEPFPDAWNNLILLLEENRSSHLKSLTIEAQFNFLNPSERIAPPGDLKNNEMQATDHISSAKSTFWSFFVRMISLFFVESSSEEFLYTFASTIRELEFLLESKDIKLNASLESYQHMDPNRIGPYRALQLVSILIFTVDSLTTSFDHKESKENTDLKKPDLVKSALSATFTILGRITERCIKNILVISSPLLPAVLVFVEWLVGKLDLVQKYVFQEEVACAVSYFLDTFVELLNRLETRDEFKNQKDIPLWEDLELRGFTPMACSHKHLKFCTHEKTTYEYFNGKKRVHRIFDAAIKIVEKSPNGFKKLILCDIEKEKLFTIEQPQPSSDDLDLKEHQQTICEVIKEKEKITKIVAMEEEEEIIFKPLVRYNSAPIYSPDIEKSPESVQDKTKPSDDSLRRATSLFAEQVQNLHSNSKTLENNHPKNKHKTMLNASATSYPAGPPSLNAWVLDKESIDKEKDKAARDFFKPRLSPIDEMGSFSLIDSPPYSAPIPSAPLLPDDAFLLCENSAIHDMNSPMSNTSNYTNKPVFDVVSSFTPMSSSEWLRQFRNQNLNRGNHLLPGNLYGNEVSRLSFINRWEFNNLNHNKIVYPEIPHLYAGSEISFVTDKLRREELFHNYQKLSPFGCCDDVADSRAEKPSLMHYFKEKELQLQNQSQVRGPAAHMGN